MCHPGFREAELTAGRASCALRHLVDVLLTRPRRRVEDLASPVGVRRIDAIQKKRVNVRVVPEVA
jgi:hypothetical protein